MGIENHCFSSLKLFAIFANDSLIDSSRPNDVTTLRSVAYLAGNMAQMLKSLAILYENG